MAKPVFLLHGAIGAADQLEPLSTLLMQQGFTCYSFSFSGHGKQAFGEQFGIKQFSEELKAFIESNHLVQPAVFGYSMGGYVALYLAAHAPDLVGNIVTLGTKFDWSKEIAEKEIKMLDAAAIEAKVPKFAAALQERHGEKWKILLEKTAAMMLDLGNTNLLSATLLQKIKNKVLVGLADKDNMVTLEETVRVYKTVPAADMFMLPASKHPIEQVNTELLSLIIDDFLKSE